MPKNNCFYHSSKRIQPKNILLTSATLTVPYTILTINLTYYGENHT